MFGRVSPAVWMVDTVPSCRCFQGALPVLYPRFAVCLHRLSIPSILPVLTVVLMQAYLFLPKKKKIYVLGWVNSVERRGAVPNTHHDKEIKKWESQKVWLSRLSVWLFPFLTNPTLQYPFTIKLLRKVKK